MQEVDFVFVYSLDGEGLRCDCGVLRANVGLIAVKQMKSSASAK